MKTSGVKTVMFMSESGIEVMSYSDGKGGCSVGEHFTQPLEAGVIANGVVAIPGALVQHLSQIKKTRPSLAENVSLVVDSNLINVKRITAPKLKKNEYQQLAYDEMAESVGSDAGVICGFDFVNPKSADSTLFICGAERSIVEGFIDAFKQAEIPLTSITVSVDGVINFVKTKTDLAKKTFIVNIVDRVNMLSIFFNEGEYLFSTRTRLLSEDITQNSIPILQNLFSLLQFGKTQKVDHVDASYYVGIDEKQLEMLNAINTNSEVSLMPLRISSDADAVGAYEMTYLGALNSKSVIDLLKNYAEVEKLSKEAQKSKNPVLMVAAAIFVLGLVGAYTYPTIQVMGLKSEIKKANDYINSAEVQEALKEIEKLQDETSKLRSVNAQYDNKLAFEQKQLKIQNRYLDIITQTNSNAISISGFSFDAEKGTIAVTGVCPTEYDAARFVEALKMNPEVDGVGYTGYSYNNKGDYNFSISVLFVYPEAEKGSALENLLKLSESEVTGA